MAGHSRPKDGVASARLCPGHPRLSCFCEAKTWMPGTSSAKTRFALLPGHDEFPYWVPLPNPPALLAPIGIPHQALVQLAVGMARQLLHEVEQARRFYAAEVGAAERGEFRLQILIGVGPIGGLDHR